MAGIAEVAAAAARELELQWAREEEREVELTAAEQWARDPVGWINGHVWIASVISDTGIRRKMRPLRMRLFPDQASTIAAWINLDHLAQTGELVLDNVAIEKSRQIGETWLFAAAICWLMLYHPGIVGGCLHTVGAEIDDGGERNTVKSLFGKIRYIERRLDRVKLPGLGSLRFWPLSNQGPAKIENLANGAVTYGEGQKDDPFRGSTLDWLLVDEAARVRHGEQVYAAVDDACPTGKALLSTPYGDDNVHARICDELPEGWKYLRLHWSSHPAFAKGLHVAAALAHDDRGRVTGVAEPGDPTCAQCAGTLAGLEWTSREPRAHRYSGKLTSPWYEQRIVGKTDEQVSSELDIDREGALTARVYQEFQTDRHVRESGIAFEPLVDVEFAWDFGLDCTSVIVLQDARELRAIGLLEMGDLFGTTATPDRVAAALRELLADLGVEERFTTPFWTKKMQGYGDPSGGDRSGPTGVSYMQEYSKQGFSIIPPSRRHTARVETNITAVKRLLLGTPKPFHICGVNAGELARHFRNNTWPVDPITQKRRKGSTKPDDNVHNHSLRALAYYVVAKYPPPVEHDQELDNAAVAVGLEDYGDRRSRRGVGSSLQYGMKL